MTAPPTPPPSLKNQQQWRHMCLTFLSQKTVPLTHTPKHLRLSARLISCVPSSPSHPIPPLQILHLVGRWRDGGEETRGWSWRGSEERRVGGSIEAQPHERAVELLTLPTPLDGHRPISLSVHASFCHPSILLSLSIILSIHRSIYQSTHPSICL